MKCTPFRLPDGTSGFICSRRKRPPPPRQCVKCGKPAELLCDYPMPRKKSGTCDRPICAACTVRPKALARTDGDTYDLCPEHARKIEEPEQLSLFAGGRFGGGNAR